MSHKGCQNYIITYKQVSQLSHCQNVLLSRKYIDIEYCIKRIAKIWTESIEDRPRATLNNNSITISIANNSYTATLLARLM